MYNLQDTRLYHVRFLIGHRWTDSTPDRKVRLSEEVESRERRWRHLGIILSYQNTRFYEYRDPKTEK